MAKKKEDSRPNMAAGVPTQNSPASPKKGEKTVTMHFPRRVVLNHEGRLHEFQPGVHEVPESMAGHQYLADHGAKRHGKKEDEDVLPHGKGGMPGSSPIVDSDDPGGLNREQTAASQRISTEVSTENAPEGEEAGEEEERVSLNSMNKEELVEYAESHDIDFEPDDTKADIIKKIKKNQ